MNKLTKRLQCIADFIEKKDKAADIGCDHGYLSIYLKRNNICESIIATDVNKNALSSAIENIKKSKLDIETILSDGLDKIDTKNLNTLIISGMGTHTILHILEDKEKIKNIKKMVIQSNNDHEILRKSMNELGYYLKDEKKVLDKNKWYTICLFVKSKNKNTNQEIEYGFLNNDDYNKYLIEEQKNINKRIPFTRIKLKLENLKKLNNLKKAIKNQ